MSLNDWNVLHVTRSDRSSPQTDVDGLDDNDMIFGEKHWPEFSYIYKVKVPESPQPENWCSSELRKKFSSRVYRPQLWSRCKIVISHATVPGSIPGRVSFLVEVFPEFSLNRNTKKCQEIWATFVPVIIWPSYIIQTIYHSFMDGDGLWPWLKSMAVVK